MNTLAEIARLAADPIGSPDSGSAGRASGIVENVRNVGERLNDQDGLRDVKSPLD